MVNCKFRKAIVGLCILSLLGWIFPDTIWDENSIQITDENGNDITAEYSGKELNEIVTNANEISFDWKIGRVVVSWFN